MFTKLIRITRDTELRHTASNKAVATIPGVYDVGWGDSKKPQWIEVTLWGKQAEALTQYLTKGKQLVIYADDLCIDEYPKKDGTTGTKLKCRAINVDLVGSKSDGQAPQQTAPQPKKATQKPANTGFNDDFDSDIPF